MNKHGVDCKCQVIIPRIWQYYWASSAHFQKIEDHRRKWDRDEYERLAAERIQEELDAQEKAQHKQPVVKRELLKQRDYRVDLESKLGKSIVITKNTPSSQTGG